ncbi:sel1 repeat family protein [Sphingomonas parva]|uniref:Sel1 repeat family protein n=1 Tax=Sphingomonas parva TaxID=2555898 RepID=A0A4Y8ZQD5_9SPHN|nr:sel1 repeat family protein [Sphingomonas parva]TFI58174.1 sel1 repeat family protein [Sphingomonas parva]
MGISYKQAQFLAASRIADAERGDVDALFELGAIYSSGAHGTPIDLVEAHKWFNLAALQGSVEAQLCRGEVADEMTRAEIAEAQKQARAWLARAGGLRIAA